MGIFDKGFKKTNKSFFEKLSRAIVGRTEVDEDVLDAIEEALVATDMGVDTSLRIIESLEERVSRDKYMNMDELVDIKKAVKPHEILLVVDALTGQDAVNVAETFNEKLGITGTILTKLDGDTRGGAALSVKAVTGKPIKFAGMGEKLSDLEPFYPDRMASRILGMGDILTLIEQAEEKIDKEQAEKSANRMMSGQFTLDDMLIQYEQLNNKCKTY